MSLLRSSSHWFSYTGPIFPHFSPSYIIIIDLLSKEPLLSSLKMYGNCAKVYIFFDKIVLVYYTQRCCKVQIEDSLFPSYLYYDEIKLENAVWNILFKHLQPSWNLHNEDGWRHFYMYSLQPTESVSLGPAAPVRQLHPLVAECGPWQCLVMCFRYWVPHPNHCILYL